MRRDQTTRLAVLVVLCAARARFPSDAQAAVRLARVFGDHMVLQRGKQLPIWGTAAPGEKVTVALAGQSLTATADKDGRWMVRLAPLKASATPAAIAASASNTVTIADVLVGDVWLCSGQSNMQWPLRRAASAATAVPAAGQPAMRLLNLTPAVPPERRKFTRRQLAACKPKTYFRGAWAACSPRTAADFSAVGYFFGLELHTRLKVPIGLIHNAIDGSPAEAWVSRATLDADPTLKRLSDEWLRNKRINPWVRERAAYNLALWQAAVAEARRDGMLTPPWPGHPFQPAFLFDAGIAPVAPFAIRGIIWYQGESNAHDAELYGKLFPAVIGDWRRAFGQRDLPFLYVQLPALERKGWPALREAQRQALAIPHTAMAVTIDIGDPSNIHPRNKRDVARRLALLARAKVYGEKLVHSGPVVAAVTREGQALRVRFTHLGGGLKTRDGKQPTGFQVAGDIGVFMAATAKLDGNDVIVSTPYEPAPVAVRYGWAPVPTASLINAEGLPASPFVARLKTKR